MGTYVHAYAVCAAMYYRHISVINAIYKELHNDYPNIRIEYGNTYYEEYIATYKTERERDAAFDEILAAIDGGE